MRTILIECELPPTRAIYRFWYEAKNETEALKDFNKEKPLYKFRKFLPVCGACQCQITEDGCGCNPIDA